MKPEKLFGIEVKADYGHFRKSFTTSSPLTHGVPPRTAIAGLLGAILGLPRNGENNYHKVFSEDNSFIAVVNDPRPTTGKQRINLNLLKVKGETEKLVKLGTAPQDITRSQVPFEIIKDPRYRIYFNSNELEDIEEFLKEEKSVYTPYFGISEYLAEYEYLEKFGVKQRDGTAEMDSVLPSDRQIEFDEGKKYVKENFSLFMNSDREVKKFMEVIYAEDGSSIKSEGTYYKVNEENIVPLE